jgi:glycosyltransferase involved in cell wall biosynthesis
MDPTVSVIIPCFNEQATIRFLLQAVSQQTYPQACIEVIIADGLSTDRTRAEIDRVRAEQPGLSIRVVDNPKRNIPTGLNLALSAARNEVIVRLDAHSVPQPDYIERCVYALAQGKGQVVGGVWDIRPGGPGWMARSISSAAANPLAVGDARYRYTTRPGEVDTVPFGAFKRSLVEQVGPYDEKLLTNEDYEFFTRVRQGGGRVWLDPAIRTIYFARSNLEQLASQYFRYGYWKQRMLRRYPGTLRWRQALPPLFLLSLVLLVVLAPFIPLAGIGLAVELGLYGSILLGTGLLAALKKKDPALILGLPLAITVMHFTWAAGFLWSVGKRDT